MSKFIEIPYPKFKLHKKVKNEFTKIQTIRIDNKQIELIWKVCKELGITRNFFISWCAYHAAININKELKQKRNKNV